MVPEGASFRQPPDGALVARDLPLSARRVCGPGPLEALAANADSIAAGARRPPRIEHPATADSRFAEVCAPAVLQFAHLDADMGSVVTSPTANAR